MSSTFIVPPPGTECLGPSINATPTTRALQARIEFSDRFWGCWRLASDLTMQPSPRERPIPESRNSRNIQDFGRLFNGEAAKIAKRDELGLERVLLAKFFEGLVERDQLIALHPRGEIRQIHLDAIKFGAVLQPILAPSILHENPPHRFCSGGEKVAAGVESGEGRRDGVIEN